MNKNYENARILELRKQISDLQAELRVEQREENAKHGVRWDIFKDYGGNDFPNGLYDERLTNTVRNLVRQICFCDECDGKIKIAYRFQANQRETEESAKIQQEMINDVYAVCAKYADKVLGRK